MTVHRQMIQMMHTIYPIIHHVCCFRAVSRSLTDAHLKYYLEQKGEKRAIRLVAPLPRISRIRWHLFGTRLWLENQLSQAPAMLIANQLYIKDSWCVALCRQLQLL